MKKIFEFKNFKSLYLISFIIIYLLLTNSYFSYDESLIFGGADGYSFFEISKASPNVTTEKIQSIHSERFFYPYIIGLFSEILTIDIYYFYRILVILIIILINLILINFFEKLQVRYLNIILILILFNLNPYLSRFYISNPLIINDLIFILGSIITIYSFNEKNKKILFVGLIIACFARQSALAIPIAMLLIKIIRKKKFFLSSKQVILSFLIFILIYSLGLYYSDLTPKFEERYEEYYISFFGFFLEDVSIKNKLKLFVWPLLSFGPLILFKLFFLNFSHKKLSKNIDISILLFSFSLLIISQSILQGYIISGKNIIRLTTMSFLPLLIFFQINSGLNKTKVNYKLAVFFIIVFIWSCHPTFSIFNFLENYRF